MASIKALIISVGTAQVRRSMQIRQLEKLRLSGEVLDAVTPDDISKADLEAYRYSWARPLKDGEIACALSHRKALEHAARKNEPTLIMEDDVLLAHDTKSVLEAILAGPKLGYISLECFNKQKLLGDPKPLTNTDYNIARLYRDRGGAAAYIVWPDTARKILDAYTHTMPIADAAINLTWGVNLYQLEPACASQASVMVCKHPEFITHSSVHQIKPSHRPPYPSKLVFIKSKWHRCRDSFILFLKTMQGLGRSSNRIIGSTVTPDILEETAEF